MNGWGLARRPISGVRQVLDRLVHRPDGSLPALAALVELGGVPGPALAPLAPEGGECVRLAVPRPRSRAEPSLVAVAARVLVPAGGITARLLAADGTILEHLYCPPRDTPYDLALFAPPGRAEILRIGTVTLESTASVLGARLVTFAARALAPERLVPQRDIRDSTFWPADPYGDPPTEDSAARLRHLVFGRLAARCAVPWLHDLAINLEPGDEQSNCLMKYGLYEPDVLSLAGSLLKRGDIFVDVGASCGIYTLFGARAVGPEGMVVAFEPSQREFSRLEGNVALNHFSHVRRHRAAVCDGPGAVTLRIAEASFSGHNTMGDHFAFSRVKTHAIETVPAVTLDAALADLPRLSLIKLDIEGSELGALRGAEATISRFHPALLLEVFEGAMAANGTTPAALMAWLSNHGYRVFDINPATGGIGEDASFPPGVNKNVLARVEGLGASGHSS